MLSPEEPGGNGREGNEFEEITTLFSFSKVTWPWERRRTRGRGVKKRSPSLQPRQGKRSFISTQKGQAVGVAAVIGDSLEQLV